MVDAYREQIERPSAENDKQHLFCLSVLMHDAGHPEEAFRILSALADHERAAGDSINLQSTLGNQALILRARGDLDGAMALHQGADRIYRQLGNLDGLSISLGNQASILQARGDLDGAMALHQEEERICRQLGDAEGLVSCLVNQALRLMQMGLARYGLPLTEEAYRLATGHGYIALAQHIKAIRNDVRRAARPWWKWW